MKSTSKISGLNRRWVDVVLYAFGGAIFGVPIGIKLCSVVQSCFSDLSGEFDVLLWLGRGSVLIGAFWILSSWIKPRFAHFGHMRWWPPTLSAVPISFWLITASVIGDRSVGWIEVIAWLNLSLSTTGFLFFAIAKAQQKKRSKSAIKTQTVDRPRSLKLLLELPLPQLNKWIESESHVVNSEDDWFQASPRAHRVLAALQTRRTSDTPNSYQSVVIQGPFGSGKTTTTRIVEDSARGQCLPVLFVQVDCWGFSTAAAQEHILEKAVTVLEEHVDCLSLRQLPHYYAATLKEGGAG